MRIADVDDSMSFPFWETVNFEWHRDFTKLHYHIGIQIFRASDLNIYPHFYVRRRRPAMRRSMAGTDNTKVCIVLIVLVQVVHPQMEMTSTSPQNISVILITLQKRCKG
jgi:hypothetical protein